MRSLFGSKGLLYLWAILTASLGLGEAIKSLADEFRNNRLDNLISQWVNDLNKIAPGIVKDLVRSLNFTGRISLPGFSFTITTGQVLIVLSLVIVAGALWLLRGAIKSKALADDFLVLAVFYVALQVMYGIWNTVGGRNDPFPTRLAAIVMTLTIVYMIRRAGAMDDSQVFFRGLLQIILVWLFLVPLETIQALTHVLDGWAGLGDALRTSVSIEAWSLVGLVLGVVHLYSVGQKPRRTTSDALDDVKKKIDEALDDAKKKSG